MSGYDASQDPLPADEPLGADDFNYEQDDSFSSEQVVDPDTAIDFDPEPDFDPSEIRPARLERGVLELEVKQVTDTYDPDHPEPLTPHRIVKAIKANREGQGIFDRRDPSTGAVTDILKRWREIGFANLAEKPQRFVGYTDEGMAHGLAALRHAGAEARKARKAARAAAMASGNDNDGDQAA